MFACGELLGQKGYLHTQLFSIVNYSLLLNSCYYKIEYIVDNIIHTYPKRAPKVYHNTVYMGLKVHHTQYVPLLTVRVVHEGYH